MITPWYRNCLLSSSTVIGVNGGSSPLQGTNFNAPVAQSWLEHPPYKWEVMGSIPHQEYQFSIRL